MPTAKTAINLLAAMLLALVMALVAVPSHALAEEGMVGGCTWTLDSNGQMTISPSPGGDGSIDLSSGQPWKACAKSITKVVFEPGVKAADPYDTTASLKGMFAGCENIRSIDFSDFDTSKARNMSQMFQGCLSLGALDLSRFNTGSVTDMSSMFENCTSLSKLNVSSFDTGLVTNMSQMFDHCKKLSELNLSSFRTPNVTIMSYMFRNASVKSLDLSSFDTSAVYATTSMFEGCTSLVYLDVSSFDTASVSSSWAMFFDCDALRQLKAGDGFDLYDLLPGDAWWNVTSGQVYNFAAKEFGDRKRMPAATYQCIPNSDLGNAQIILPDEKFTYETPYKLPKVTVTLAGFTLVEGVHYEIHGDYESTDLARITVYGKEPFSNYKTITYKVSPASSSKKPSASNGGSGTGDSGSGSDGQVTAAKKANKITVTAPAKTYKRSVLRAKARSFKIAAKAKGGAKVTYKLYKRLKTGKVTAKKVKKWVAVNASGKVTVKKGAPRGTYRLKVKITAKATKAYKKTTVTKTITIKVK